MILTTVRHGRTSRDVRKLKAHLDKSMGQVARVATIGNCPVADADAAMSYMEAMRDGSRAEVACHHVTISPRSRLDDAQRDEAVRRVLAAYGAEDHAYVLWEHDEKSRAIEGGSEQHFHLVIGHIGDDLKALDDSQSFTKLEAVARTLEADFGEPLTVSRRTAAVAAELHRIGRADVADMLVQPPEPPRSSMSSASRAAAARAGVDLPAMKAAVKAAYESADSPAAFRAALADQGLEIAPGKKAGVYVVVSGETTVGALDRLIKAKRDTVADLVKGFDHDRTAKASTEDAALKSVGGGYPSQDELGRESRPVDTGRRAETATAPGAVVGASGERPAVPDRGIERHAGSDPVEPAAPDDAGRGSRSEARRDRLRLKVAERQLRKVDTSKLKSLAAELRDFSRPALDRIRDGLGRRRASALDVYTSSVMRGQPSAALSAIRGELQRARKDSQDMFYTSLPVVRTAEEKLWQPEPKGIWDRILGRHRTWSNEVVAAEQFLSTYRDAQARLRERVAVLEDRAKPLEKQHEATIKAEERRHEERRQSAAYELRVLDVASDILATNPDLAKRGEAAVLQAAQRRLDVEERRKEDRFDPPEYGAPAFRL